MNRVVNVIYPEPTIAVVTLEDRVSHNTFSQDFIRDLMDAFANFHPDTKVVVVHGYDNYFCCGGTQEELLKLFDMKDITFADIPFYRLLVDCEIPTISAMQGHALGGGLAFGSFADFIILSEESIYSTNFMKYGFTPGMGSTYIIPKKFGEVLGTEMLLTARYYHGEELRNRNVPIKVIKKQEVINAAMELAKELADKPLPSLKLLKKRLVEKTLIELPAAIRQEIEMHKVSFKLPEVRERILKLFNE